MRKGVFGLIVCISALNVAPVLANWQYSGEYTYDMNEYDSGERISVSVRGGATYAFAKMHNDTSIVFAYCVNSGTGEIQEWGGACPSGFEYATADLGGLGLGKMSQINFAAGASIGWVLPNTPQWRLELGWDRFSDSDYNETPLFRGDIMLSNGETISNFDIGGVQSTMATDIISAMIFYDFFTGTVKPAHSVIPYVGLGFGYGDTKTVMNFYDNTGDLSSFNILQQFGEYNGAAIDFYKSTTTTTNIAAVAALGFSFGINRYLFVDMGARISYLPRVKYQLVNSDDSRRMDWFSAKNLIYTNVMLGLRMEF